MFKPAIALFLTLGACLAAAGAAEPVVRPLVPGIRVEELPVKLTNINNLRFDPKGRLFALGYNGKLYLLSDGDADGLEDAATAWWDKPPLQVPVGLAWSPRGWYVSSHGKVSLLSDSDGDDRGDKEQVVSSGWPSTDVHTGGVDATAVTLDRDGNLYFGLLCADYTNAYRVKEGKSRYDLTGLRGSIVRLAAGGTQPEIVATGVRVPYTLAFNRLGDLFLTDQEGETWLPGGNPLDELNHIQQGRHYGFPPRHEQHLPGVVDEPAVVGFSPQHQSTCGLAFNEAAGGKTFGPAWDGDAFVAGFSRGKLWRVRLVKTPHGYVGRPSLIATSSMMLADVALSPRGDLYLACHSGPPDWGTGPQGEGRLFRLRYVDPEAPQPVIAWSSSPTQVRVAFDRPLPDDAFAKALAGQTIEYGQHVRAGDRYELLKPPYATVQQQQKSRRGKLKIASAALSDDRRTLLLTTERHATLATYALSIAGVSRVQDDPPIELDYSFSGVWARWQSASAAGQESWSGWLPHLDLEVSRSLTAGSAEHDRLFELLKTDGKLWLMTTAILPSADAELVLESNLPRERLIDERDRSKPGQSVRLSVLYRTGGTAEPSIRAFCRAPGDPHPRVLRFEQLHVPWAPEHGMPLDGATAAPAELAGGDVARGRELFFGEKARCSACHRLEGKGTAIGPDLGNLAHRDAASVLRDIATPAAALNPDYVGYTLELTDGRTLSGLVRSDGERRLVVYNSKAEQTTIERSEVAEMVPQRTSIMPDNLAETIGQEGLRDLVAFLLAQPKPDAAAAPQAPPPRKRADVERAIRAVPAAEGEAARRPLKLLLVWSKQDHGPGEHDYPAWAKKWQPLLAKSAGVEASTAENWPSADDWAKSDVVVLYCWNHQWSAERFKQLDAFQARGGGIVALHAGIISDDDPEALAQRLGLAAQPVRTKYRHGATTLTFLHPQDDALTRGLDKADFLDETYWPLVGDRTKVTVLATAVEERRDWPMLWKHQRGNARVLGCVLGHYAWTFDDPLFRLLVLRGIGWAGHCPEGRLQDLATVGVTLAD